MNAWTAARVRGFSLYCLILLFSITSPCKTQKVPPPPPPLKTSHSGGFQVLSIFPWFSLSLSLVPMFLAARQREGSGTASKNILSFLWGANTEVPLTGRSVAWLLVTPSQFGRPNVHICSVANSTSIGESIYPRTAAAAVPSQSTKREEHRTRACLDAEANLDPCAIKF